MSAIISKREAVALLRRVATKGITVEDSKSLRILAGQLQREIDNHNETAKRSRDKKHKIIHSLIKGAYHA